nr:MAG TPA: hypothetical protein [Caudoviricetes sp.]
MKYLKIHRAFRKDCAGNLLRLCKPLHLRRRKN